MNYIQEEMLNVFKEMRSVNVKETPTHFFYTELKKNLMQLDVPSNIANDILCHVKVEISCGYSYKSHEEFLTKGAKLFAESVWNVYQSVSMYYHGEFSPDVALKFMEESTFKYTE